MFNPIIRDSFLGEFDNIFNAVRPKSSGFSVYTGSVTPKANVSKDEKGYQISLAAPGLSRGDFNIEVTDGILSVSTNGNVKSDKNALRQEYSYHKFSRSWSLPENVVVENISADYIAGILNLNIPVENINITKTKKIEVQ